MNYRTYQEYQKAFSEINFIIENSEKDIQEKIPSKFMEMIKNNIDRNYIVKLDLEHGIENCVLLDKTKDILSFIYKNFICTEGELEELLNKWESQKEVYNIEELFCKNSSEKKQELNFNPEQHLVKIDDKKWYEKIKDKFQQIFRK